MEMVNRPALVWVNDDPTVLAMYRLKLELDDIEEELGIETRFFGNSDLAIEFTLQNVERIFMFILDASRPQGSIIPRWQSLMRARCIPITGPSSEFYTYVIDAFTPMAAVCFCGNGWSADDARLILQWSAYDSRIVFQQMSQFMPRQAAPLIRDQFRQWVLRRPADLTSPDVGLAGTLSEELATLCAGKPEFVHSLTPRKFEELVASLFRNHGFDVELTGQTRDGGYDLVAISSTKLESETSLVEVKHFAPSRPVGVGVVRALYGVKHLRSASKAMLVTSSYVSKDAHHEFSRVIPWEMEFVEHDRLMDWVNTYAKHILVTRIGDEDE